MKEEKVTYKDKSGKLIHAIFFDNKVQYKKEDSRYTRVVTYPMFLQIINKLGWIKNASK